MVLGSWLPPIYPSVGKEWAFTLFSSSFGVRGPGRKMSPSIGTLSAPLNFSPPLEALNRQAQPHWHVPHHTTSHRRVQLHLHSFTCNHTCRPAAVTHTHIPLHLSTHPQRSSFTDRLIQTQTQKLWSHSTPCTSTATAYAHMHIHIPSLTVPL